MRILLYFGHPAQYLFLRESMRRLSSNGHQLKVLIKTKDVLENLMLNDGFEFENILPQERGKSKFSIALSLIRRNLKILPIVLKFKPSLMIGTDATIAQLGKLLSINRITITEDDYSVIKTLGDLTYPFTSTILCPTVCKVGKWDNKKIGYRGYMKLGYLHPNVFKFNNLINKKYKLAQRFSLIRLARLTAHHDFGVKGIDNVFLDKLITNFEQNSYRVYISAEGVIDSKYNNYLLKINPNDMHHVLSAASLLICDSQSMSVEAAVLGTPSIRYSSFAGKISVLEELEHKYRLTFGIHPNRPDQFFAKLNSLLSINNLKEEFQSRRKKMLDDKIDVTSFLVWFIGNYPESIQIMNDTPEYQNKFK